MTTPNATEMVESVEMRDEQRFLDEAYTSGQRCGRDQVIHEILHGVALRDILPKQVNMLLGNHPDDPQGMNLVVRIAEEFKTVFLAQSAPQEAQP